MIYTVKESLKPENLSGISIEQIEQHWKLYAGYVSHCNKLHEELKTINPSSLSYTDRRRRFGFEYNGMILHELYFANLKNNESAPCETFQKAVTENWGSFEAWKNDFASAGKTRGIGWAILYAHPETKLLLNAFVADHELGIIATCKPLLVMDVWEHAYMVDHGATERGKYIDAFMNNIDWNIVSKRYEELV
jgi:superoxide dismutase, Fe-Mn family